MTKVHKLQFTESGAHITKMIMNRTMTKTSAL